MDSEKAAGSGLGPSEQVFLDHVCIRDVSGSELYWRIPEDARELNWAGEFLSGNSPQARRVKADLEAELGYEGWIHSLWSFCVERIM